jgi:hypothetical protein
LHKFQIRYKKTKTQKIKNDYKSAIFEDLIFIIILKLMNFVLMQNLKLYFSNYPGAWRAGLEVALLPPLPLLPLFQLFCYTD